MECINLVNSDNVISVYYMTLIDKFGRTIDYLRISVTDRCNLRCIYCMPAEGVASIEHSEILRYEEILKIIDIALQLGIKKIRITGGEPLVRKGIIEFLSEVSKKNIDFSITTNGVLLGDFAMSLREAGVKRINVSLDTLSEKKFSEITRGGNIKKVINGILKAKELGIVPIKINTVMLPDTTEEEMKSFIDFTKSNGLILRFIEHLPFVKNRTNLFVNIEKDFKMKYNLIPVDINGFGPGRHYKVNGAIIGFISAISRPFCEKCNRLRLTSDGRLLPCLSSSYEVDLKNPLREGASDDKIKSLFLEAVLKKPEKHSFLPRFPLRGGGEQPRDCMVVKSMVGIGG